jgi:hypothetical protein
MHEKRGIIDEQHTRPEVPEEKDLEQHVTKRAAAKIEKLVVPNVQLTEEQHRKFRQDNEKLSPAGQAIGHTKGVDRIKLDR